MVKGALDGGLRARRDCSTLFRVIALSGGGAGGNFAV